MRLCLDNIYIFKYTNERKNETKYKNGFTLAEVLITLGIVGVVAALTIPNLRNAYKAHYLKSKFLKIYSTLSQAIKLMENDNIQTVRGTFQEGQDVTINLAKYLKGASVQYRNYAQTFRVTNREHKSMDGTVVGSYFFDDGLTIMGDNTWLFTELGGQEHIITVDINGHLELPNKFDYDLFSFQILKTGEFVPMVAKGTKYTDKEKYCNLNTANNLNGVACAEKALHDANYFKWAVKNIK